jgi:GAF domain-containing protein
VTSEHERLEALTRELQEALAHEAATAEILRVISRSAGSLQPVFDAIAASANRLCDGVVSTIVRLDGEMLHLAAHHNLTPDQARALRRIFPVRATARAVAVRAIADRHVVHVADVTADPAYAFLPLAREIGYRSFLSVPMVREHRALGAINVGRRDPLPFTERQIRLLQTFADQAVIAIEAARLLEQQTATGDILQAIRRPPADLQPVLDVIAESAGRACASYDASVFLREGDRLVWVAHHGPIPMSWPESSLPLSPDIITGRTVLEGRALRVTDLSTSEDFPEGREYARRHGYRAVLCAPLLREGASIGVLALRRREAQPFTDEDLVLLQSFADQAVTAIENVRLFTALDTRNRELTEALEQQAATAEILRVMSRSLGELQPVFDAIAAKAPRVSDGVMSALLRLEGGVFHLAAYDNLTATQAETVRRVFPLPMDMSNPGLGSRAILERRAIHVADVTANRTWRFLPLAEEIGLRSFVAVPMLRDGQPLGVICVARRDPVPFTDRQIRLLETFADQAVIAIEGARLFHEIRETSGELAALNATLESRVASQVAQLERLGRLKRFFSPKLAELIVAGGTQDPLRTHREHITVVFLDLRGFTAFAEMADPEEIMAVLREYHGEMGRLILAHEGTLERFTGDGMMVFFNDPVPVENPAEAAVRMAVAMRERVAELIEGWRRRGYELGLGIGIADGYATIGAIGFEGRWDYGAIGTVTNLAARLCSEAKPGQILVSRRLLGPVEDLVRAEPMGDLTLKGFLKSVAAFNIVGLK